MVDQAVKIVLAMGIFLGGVALAMLFRHSPSRAGAASPGVYQPLLLRQQAAAEESESEHSPFAAESDLVDLSVRNSPTPEEPPTVLVPMDPGKPPPFFAKSYPEPHPAATARWGDSMALGPAGAEQPPRTHTIIDGDTLPALAERYLGSADRSMEIYEANRAILLSPEVLPIGAELEIPSSPAHAAASTREAGQQPLVPIPPGSFRRSRSSKADRWLVGPGIRGVRTRERSD